MKQYIYILLKKSRTKFNQSTEIQLYEDLFLRFKYIFYYDMNKNNID